jgi:opacity protein-like surface antigen
MNGEMASNRQRRRLVVAAVVLAATMAAAGSAWAASPIPPQPGSTWTDAGQGTVTSGIPVPHSR